jgi:hypothetical protein
LVRSNKPVRLKPDVSQELEEIINRALEKDRNLSYQHANEMRELIGALARIGLARARCRVKLPNPARPTMIFALWKVADPDIPILKRAKAEYARPQ